MSLTVDSFRWGNDSFKSHITVGVSDFDTSVGGQLTLTLYAVNNPVVGDGFYFDPEVRVTIQSAGVDETVTISTTRGERVTKKVTFKGLPAGEHNVCLEVTNN